MGNNASVKIANSTLKDAWVRVEAERKYLVALEESVKQKIGVTVAGVGASAEAEVGKKEQYAHIAQQAGYNRVPSAEYINFDVPHDKYECYISAFDSEGEWFGSAKCFRATNLSYFNVVLCSDHAMRKGFKNRTFRCAEGMQQYWGPFCCPGCGTQRCKSPESSGSDGWCAKVGKGNPHYFTRLDQ